MFPESMPSHFAVPKLLPFESDAFTVAAETGVPVVPIVVKNYSESYGSRSQRWTRGGMEARILLPRSIVPGKNDASDLHPSKWVQEASERVREDMLEALQGRWS
jgi:1-acyl-sn-glycerol-3-phosphate acyltransferase